MAQEPTIEPLTDEELQWVAENKPELVNSLNSDERRRLSRFTASPAQTSTPSRMDAIKDSVARAVSPGPAIGATVGGILYGPGGAAIGGAAGRGYEDLGRHLDELPGAVVDVARGLASNPKETFAGFKQGAQQGALDASVAAGVNAGMDYVGGKAMSGLASTAKGVYRGYLKPSLAGTAIKDAQQIVNTALEEVLPIARAGTEKANRLIGDLKAQVDGMLAGHTGSVDLKDIANRVRAFARTKYFGPGTPLEDYQAAMRVADNIDSHPSLGLQPGHQGPVPQTMTEANIAKRRLQSSASDAYGVERSAQKEAEKAGARELRLDLEKQAPDIAPLNARESKLIDAARAIARATEREANHNSLVGVKTVVAAGAGGAEYGRTGDPYSAAAKALALRVALTPEVASRMAIVAYHIGRKIPGVVPASAARLALAALQEQGQREQGKGDDTASSK